MCAGLHHFLPACSLCVIARPNLLAEFAIAIKIYLCLHEWFVTTELVSLLLGDIGISARTLVVLDADGRKVQLNVKKTHTTSTRMALGRI